jgi:outer membrane protein assembly factor BamD (BamD/ComL family)
LGEENRLFKEAAEASRQGDVPRALGRLDELLQKHPGSPLAQTAQVRKFRLLVQAGRSEDARREAARYLASYPTGFAVAEAQALQAPSTPPTSKPSPVQSASPPEPRSPSDTDKAKEPAP